MVVHSRKLYQVIQCIHSGPIFSTASNHKFRILNAQHSQRTTMKLELLFQEVEEYQSG
ncbi:unnamed protein product, partial [Vitis vinifera]|uniref:Uncharacterized protein n=1 Tax=Vitis vinifera TaxID=29760 RepID=D7TFZ3_VITVI